MKFFALLVLCLLPLQEPTQKPETVALVFGPEPEQIHIWNAQLAEEAYRTLEQRRKTDGLNRDLKRLHAALTVALGTRETAPHVNSTRERLDWEIRRGVRKPLQPPDPQKEN